LPAATDEVSVTVPPWQKVVDAEAEMIGVDGTALTERENAVLFAPSTTQRYWKPLKETGALFICRMLVVVPL
jgi:hypothetical protein